MKIKVVCEGWLKDCCISELKNNPDKRYHIVSTKFTADGFWHDAMNCFLSPHNWLARVYLKDFDNDFNYADITFYDTIIGNAAESAVREEDLGWVLIPRFVGDNESKTATLIGFQLIGF